MHEVGTSFLKGYRKGNNNSYQKDTDVFFEKNSHLNAAELQLNIANLFKWLSTKFTYIHLNKVWNMFKVNDKDTRMKSINIILVSLLLTLNIFHTSSKCFYGWLGTDDCLLIKHKHIYNDMDELTEESIRWNTFIIICISILTTAWLIKYKFFNEKRGMGNRAQPFSINSLCEILKCFRCNSNLETLNKVWKNLKKVSKN